MNPDSAHTGTGPDGGRWAPEPPTIAAVIAPGDPVVGPRGEALGHVGAVYADTGTGQPVWADVAGGVGSAIVPLAGSRFDGTTLHLPYDAQWLRTAPGHEPEALVGYAEAEALTRHYDAAATAAVPGHTGPDITGIDATAAYIDETQASATSGEVSVVRSEERLQVSSQWVRVGRARLVTYLVTEDKTFTVPVTRQEVRLVVDGPDGPDDGDPVLLDGPAPEETYEVIRHEEQVQLTTRVVPVERVRMIKRRVTTEHTVTAALRHEQIDADQTGPTRPSTGD